MIIIIIASPFLQLFLECNTTIAKKEEMLMILMSILATWELRFDQLPIR